MSTRNAEVKAYVLPEVKTRASQVFARWGLSLSDAINSFLIKAVDVGGLPFEMRLDGPAVYNADTVIPINPNYGSSVLPADMNDDEDGLYEHLV